MVMRRNGVMDISAAGSSTIKVSDSAICIGRLSVVAEPLAPMRGERRVRKLVRRMRWSRRGLRGTDFVALAFLP